VGAYGSPLYRLGCLVRGLIGIRRPRAIVRTAQRFIESEDNHMIMRRDGEPVVEPIPCSGQQAVDHFRFHELDAATATADSIRATQSLLRRMRERVIADDGGVDPAVVGAVLRAQDHLQNLYATSGAALDGSAFSRPGRILPGLPAHQGLGGLPASRWG
jgi:hypothetical protein